jgi:hypothetical protein
MWLPKWMWDHIKIMDKNYIHFLSKSIWSCIMLWLLGKWKIHKNESNAWRKVQCFDIAFICLPISPVWNLLLFWVMLSSSGRRELLSDGQYTKQWWTLTSFLLSLHKLLMSHTWSVTFNNLLMQLSPFTVRILGDSWRVWMSIAWSNTS